MVKQTIDWEAMSEEEIQEQLAKAHAAQQRRGLAAAVEQFEASVAKSAKLLHQYVKAPDGAQDLLWSELSAALSDTGQQIRQIQSTWRAGRAAPKAPKKEG